MTARTYLTIAVIAAALGACGGGGADGAALTEAPPDGHTIVGTPSLTFTPGSLTVSAGDEVTFSFGRVAHNVFFEGQVGAPADIGGQNADRSVRRTFATPGTYRFICHIHPTMRGFVVVE